MDDSDEQSASAEEEGEEEEYGEDGVGDESPGGGGVLIRATPTLPSLADPVISYQVREIGHEAVWSLSTAKPGNGVEQIRDNSVDTYWQSDGAQPHLINIQFAKRQTVSEIAFYLDYGLDESYTPLHLSIKVGLTFHDLAEVKSVKLQEPCGWCSVPLYRLSGDDPLDEDDGDENCGGNGEGGEQDGDERDQEHLHLSGQRRPLRTHFVQVSIANMHQNGRDTHCRLVKIFGPRKEGHGVMLGGDQRRMLAATASEGNSDSTRVDKVTASSGAGIGWETRILPKYQTPELDQFSIIR